MFKKKTLVAGLSALLLFGPIGLAWAQSTSGDSVLPYRPESEIPHAIGVYITKRGQDKIFNNIPSILERNGLSISQAYFHKQHVEMEEKSLEEMLPTEGAFRDAALKIKETLQRFLMGLDFNDHKFAVDIEGVDVNIDWEDVRVVLNEESKHDGRLELRLILETNGLDISVNKVRAQDLGNDFLGLVGLDDFSVYQKKSTEALRFEIPVTLENRSIAEGPKLVIGNLETNIENVELGAEIRGNILLPEIELRINGRVIRANYTELENMLKENEERIVQSVKKTLQSWVVEDASVMINDMLEGKNNDGLFQDVNVMSPAGAPEDQIVVPFQWGIKLKNYDFVGDNLHLRLDGYFKDEFKGESILPIEYMANTPPRVNRVSNNNDFVLSVNEGFINRIVQLSYFRGYFSSFETEDGESYTISSIPEFKLKGASDTKPAKLGVELEYTVTGVGATLVNNPIRINFDMFLDFPVEDGKVKIIATEIDMDSVHVDKKYIKRFLGLMSWSGVVMPQVRKRFESAQNDVRGMVLADEFPIPESMGGLPMNVVDTSMDSNGHIMIHIDTNLDN